MQMIAAALVLLFALAAETLAFILNEKKFTRKLNEGLAQFNLKVSNRKEIFECFNEIAKRNKKTLETVKSLSDGIMQISGDLSYSAEEFNISMKEISRRAASMADTAADQSENIGKIKDFISGIYQKSQENLVNCGSTQDISNASYNTIVERKQKVDVIINEFYKVIEKIDKMDLSMKKLEESYKSIQSMISGIENISKQTNLLALNASIEAARAGEHGKGFNVVAMEIRVLAEECSKVVKSIIGMMHNVMRDTECTGQSMRECIGDINGQFSELRGSIKDMKEIEENISKMLEGISSLIENDRSLVSEYNIVNGQVANLDQIADSNMQQVAAVSSSIEDEYNSVNGLLDIANNLEDISGNLFKFITENKKTDSNAADNTVVVAISEYPPFIIDNSEGIGGIDVEIIRESLRRRNIETVFNSLPFDTTLRMLKKGQVDIVPTLSYKKEREEYMYFSKPYRNVTKYVFVTRKDSNIQISSFEDLEKYNIGVVKGYNYVSEFANNNRVTKEECISEDIMFTKLLKEQIDAFIINEFTLSNYLSKSEIRDKINVQSFSIKDNTSDTRMAFSKARKLEWLAEVFESGFDEIKSDGTLDKIYKKYTFAN